ncbi:hypothetical protein SYNPS1DRAFT_26267 [Syncephalis pseudoplumigaleata]|uniref:MalT-like TPR region domain-containing protein n=1 Tax=Syncephalis pseudoplumigaleata TaxID=1712513 RepID=A0A4P9Z687_9FUNG|nr:hypothetical protein SYNPS1DRAFT_26267 [Syncephalis pseudoplumigaleata]|eukprot:RKP28153.1 hypothetical protein SYNPS1DRAFT_26267 [Syncephalis pseudoplumigaleata]
MSILRTRLSVATLRTSLLYTRRRLVCAPEHVVSGVARRAFASSRGHDDGHDDGDPTTVDMASYQRVAPVSAQQSHDPGRRPLRLGDVLPELTAKEHAEQATPATSAAASEGKRKGSAKRALYDLPWLILKLTVAFGAATIAAGGVAFMGLHAFAEYYAAPDKRLPSEVRSLLRGAYVRDTLLPEPAAVAKYLEKALVLMEVSTAEIPRSAIVATHYWLAYTLERLGRLAEAADLYRTVLKAWSTPERTSAVAAAATASASPSPVATLTEVSRMVAVSRRLGETLTRLGNLDEAGRVLWAAVHAANPPHVDYLHLKSMFAAPSIDAIAGQPPAESHHSPEAVRCVVSLANVLALQRQFDDALTLYAGALRAAQAGIQRERETGRKATLYWSHTAVPASNTWTCLDAQVMGHLAEIYAIREDSARASEWSQRGLTLSKSETGEPACDACTGMILANMALLKEADGHTLEAQQLFARAHSYAKKAGDIQAMMEYGQKARQLRKAIEADASPNAS